MSNYNMKLQSNNTDLQTVLQNLQNKAAGSGQATPVISVDSNGLITATAGTKSTTKQLPTQTTRTITPSTFARTAVNSGVYTTGAITVAGDANLVPANIKNGVSIFGVEGTVDANGVQLPTLTNAGTEADLRSGKQLIDGNGHVITGTGPFNSNSATKKDVNFYDYDGTLLYSYTVNEAQALMELPGLPTQSGLTCQGWNYDLDTIKSYNRAVDVGATYITDDGKTRLYIRIAAEGRMVIPLYFSQTVANGVTIDWGDGSSTESLADIGNVNTSHIYTEIGDYVISLEVTNGTLGFGGNFSYCVMGSTGYSSRVYCNMLQKVEIGNGVTSIGKNAFNWCYSLASIVIPDGITNISNDAFDSCHSLASVVIPDSVTSIYGGAFSSCDALASIVIPDGITSISEYAFNSCHSLASIVIPDSVTSIYGSAFNSCESLASIVIPDGITSISEYAFNSCYSLASIVIPDSVTSISNSAFSNCFGMAIYDFTSHTSVPTLSNVMAFNGIPSDCVIKVPATLYDEWIAATNWSTYASQIVAV